MSTDQQIKISPEVLFRELDGEAVILDLATERYYGLDEVGTRMWQLLEEHGQTAPVIAQLLAEYDVDEEKVSADLAELIDKLAEAGLILIDAHEAESAV